MKIRKKGLATAVLALSAAGAAGFGWMASETGGFLSGLAAHGCLAATIGGLADWFAVTAIFRKPLGISYRTDILRRSRPRIMHSLAEFAGRDLLSRENVAESLSKQDFSEMLSKYLVVRGGRERIFALADAVFTRGIETLNMEEISNLVAPSLQRAFADIRIDEMAGKVLDSAFSDETADRLVHLLIPHLRSVWHDEELQTMLLSSIENIRETYVGDQSMRMALFDMDELSDEKLLERLNEYVKDWIDDMESGEGETYQKTYSWMVSFLHAGEQREKLLTALRRWQLNEIDNADISGKLTWGLEQLRENCFLGWRKKLRSYLENQIDSFLQDEDAKLRFNAWILQWLDGILASHHDELPQMMERQLAKMTDDEMVELVETRVEDDLQMIRINGAVIGSIAGMLLYILTSAAERMWV